MSGQIQPQSSALRVHADSVRIHAGKRQAYSIAGICCASLSVAMKVKSPPCKRQCEEDMPGACGWEE